MSDEPNTRILVIDDDASVRDTFREVFSPVGGAPDPHHAGEASVIANAPRVARWSARSYAFEIDFADSGARGIQKVREAMKADRPYAAIFVDMHLPGLDGLETVEIIRSIDVRAEIILITAHRYHTIQTVTARVGENVGYHCKPLAPEEIHQIATKAVSDWNKIRSLESVLEVTSSLSLHHAAVEVILHNVVDQVLGWLGATSALLIERREGIAPLVQVAVGAMGEPDVAARAIAAVLGLAEERDHGRIGDLVYFPFERFTIVAASPAGRPVPSEKIPLIRLFLQHAAIALENARLQEQLARADRLAVVGRAMGQVVHDLRQPISVIHGALRLASIEPPGDGLTELMAIAERATDDLMAYVSDVVDFTREASVIPTATSAAELLAGVVERTRFVVAEAGVTLETRAPEGLIFPFDRRKLGRVVVNLVMNAVEALVAAPTRPARPTVTITLFVDGDRVICEVSDNGPGISNEVASNIFDPFVTHGKVGGSGLGLAIVRQIVEAHGGTIGVSSTEGGATFRCDLPRFSRF